MRQIVLVAAGVMLALVALLGVGFVGGVAAMLGTADDQGLPHRPVLTPIGGILP